MFFFFGYVWVIDWSEVCVCLCEEKRPLACHSTSNLYIICSKRLTSSEVKPLNQFISTVNDTGFESMMSECDIGEGWRKPTNSPEFSKFFVSYHIWNPEFWLCYSSEDWAPESNSDHEIEADDPSCWVQRNNIMSYMWHWFIRWKFISCDQKGTLY